MIGQGEGHAARPASGERVPAAPHADTAAVAAEAQAAPAGAQPADTPSSAAADDDDADREALARTAAGDLDAFQPLVERHQDRLLALCQRLLGDREAARDAAQEVFLKAYRKAGDFEPRAQVSTWLYRIAVNHCLNLLRRRRIARFLPWGGAGAGEGGDDEPAPFDPPDEAPGPQAAAESRHRWRRVRRAIEALPPGQRAVLVLVRFEGLAYKEAAAALGITVGAVESRLIRALRNLDAALAQDSAPAGVPGTRRTR